MVTQGPEIETCAMLALTTACTPCVLCRQEDFISSDLVGIGVGDVGSCSLSSPKYGRERDDRKDNERARHLPARNLLLWPFWRLKGRGWKDWVSHSATTGSSAPVLRSVSRETA